MCMKTFGAVVCAFFITIHAVSQVDTAKTTSRPQVKYRNEIGANVGPIALVILGGDPTAQPLWALTYKRVYNKFALRVTAGFRDLPPSYFGYNNNEQAYAIDSLYRTRSVERTEKDFVGRAGIEQRKKLGHGITFVYGLDLMLMQQQWRIKNFETTYHIDSISQKGTPDQTVAMTQTGRQTLRNVLERSIAVGIGASAGLMVPFGRHWWLLGQFRADAFWGTGMHFYTDRKTGNQAKTRYSSFDFSAGPPVSELCVFYRF